LFNQDLSDAGTFPRSVVDFKARIKAADALLIATPEYHYSVPDVLKNAVDWASQSIVESPFHNKPASGNLTDETTRGFLRKLLEALYNWTLVLTHTDKAASS
jgi:NAD(P)H-dependent FMN reductase